MLTCSWAMWIGSLMTLQAPCKRKCRSSRSWGHCPDPVMKIPNLTCLSPIWNPICVDVCSFLYVCLFMKLFSCLCSSGGKSGSSCRCCCSSFVFFFSLSCSFLFKCWACWSQYCRYPVQLKQLRSPGVFQSWLIAALQQMWRFWWSTRQMSLEIFLSKEELGMQFVLLPFWGGWGPWGYANHCTSMKDKYIKEMMKVHGAGRTRKKWCGKGPAHTSLNINSSSWFSTFTRFKWNASTWAEGCKLTPLELPLKS